MNTERNTVVEEKELTSEDLERVSGGSQEMYLNLGDDDAINLAFRKAGGTALQY